MAGIGDLRKQMTRRSDLIDGLLSVLEKKVKASERQLLALTIEEFADKLELTEGGRVRNTLYNKRLLANIDRIFDRFARTSGVEMAKTIAQGVQSVVNFNGDYYRMFTTRAQLLPISSTVKEFVQSWLGLTERGAVKPNGYLDKLVKDTTVRNHIKDFALRSVIGQQGWQDSKKQLQTIIAGDKERTGRLSQYYRNFVYDTYSQVDRATGEVYAEKLGLQFAVYEGGIIKTTRTFCKQHNGNVYHRKEIEAFNPPTAKPPNYNPFTDLGGYACRHHLNYIPDALAYMMRPDARDEFKDEQSAPQQPSAEPARKETNPPEPRESAQERFDREQAERIAKEHKLIDEIKTKSDARKYVQDMINRRRETDVKAKIAIAQVMDVETLKTYLKSIAELFEEYNRSHFENLFEVSFRSRGGVLGEVARYSTGGEIARINFGNRTSESRTNNWEGVTKLVNAVNSRVDKENKLVATAVHEFAHVINSTIGNRNSEFFTEIRTIKSDYHRELSDLVRQGRNDEAADIYLGRYASTNDDEFWAEAFTEYRLSSNPSKYARRVGELGDKYYKKQPSK